MDFHEYQMKCRQTDVWHEVEKDLDLPLEPPWMYYVLGMAGEMGEFQEKIKKLFRDKKGVPTFEISKDLAYEIGDILWYMARFCDELGIPFDDIPTLNIDKLFSRKDRGKLQGDGDDR